MLTTLSFSTVSPQSLLAGRIKSKTQGFTLIELITVVVIISILISLGVPLYNKTVERARNQEAKTNLLLIQAAEEIYLVENNEYFPTAGGVTSDITDINVNLHLDLNENFWDYRIDSWGGAFPGFLATATRLTPNGGYNRFFRIQHDMASPICSGTCP